MENIYAIYIIIDTASEIACTYISNVQPGSGIHHYS